MSSLNSCGYVSTNRNEVVHQQRGRSSCCVGLSGQHHYCVSASFQPANHPSQFVDSKTEKTYKLYNPATDEFVADVHQAGPQDVDAAVAAAEVAFPAWRDTPVLVKSEMFRKLSMLINQSKEDLWNLERMAMGRSVPRQRSKFKCLTYAVAHLDSRSLKWQPALVSWRSTPKSHCTFRVNRALTRPV